MRKALLLLLIVKISFACCCSPGSCVSVRTTLTSSIKTGNILMAKNDSETLGLFWRKTINPLLKIFYNEENLIKQSVSIIKGLKKTQGLFQLEINKKLIKITNLYILLNKAKLLNSKNIILTNKELFFQSLKEGKEK